MATAQGKRILGVGLAIVVVGLTAFALLGSRATTDEQVRALFDDLMTAYEGRDHAGCMQAFAAGYADQSRKNIDREMIDRLLTRAFESQLRTRVRILPDTVLVTEHDADHASIALELKLELRGRLSWLEQWRFQVDAELAREPGGWKIVSSEHETLSGTRPRTNLGGRR